MTNTTPSTSNPSIPASNSVLGYGVVLSSTPITSPAIEDWNQEGVEAILAKDPQRLDRALPHLDPKFKIQEEKWSLFAVRHFHEPCIKILNKKIAFGDAQKLMAIAIQTDNPESFRWVLEKNKHVLGESFQEWTLDVWCCRCRSCLDSSTPSPRVLNQLLAWLRQTPKTTQKIVNGDILSNHFFQIMALCLRDQNEELLCTWLGDLDEQDTVFWFNKWPGNSTRIFTSPSPGRS